MGKENTLRYKIGDVVTIREDLNEYGGYPMYGDTDCYPVGINHTMCRLRGEKVVICGFRSFHQEKELGYTIKHAGRISNWLWTDTMFVDDDLPEISAEELKTLYDWV